MNIRLPDSLQSDPAAVQGFPDSVRQANPRTRLIASAAAIVIALIAVWYLIDTLTAPPERVIPPPPVRVGTVTQSNVTAYEQTIGTVVANATVQITSRVDGQLDSAAFVEGQTVKAGDILFRLDPKPFEAALAQAKAATARDEASLASANNDAKRYSILAKMGAASSSQRDQFVAQARALTATVKADKAAADMAALNLEWSVIRSLVDGKTGPILIQPGNLIKANDTNALVVINQIEPIYVTFALPGSLLGRVLAAQHAAPLAVSVSIDGIATPVQGQVAFIDNAVDSATGTIKLRGEFANSEHLLWPGQLVGVSLTLGHDANAVVVPDRAVQNGPDGKYVFVVDARQHAEQRKVDSPRIVEGVAVVTSGLAAGESVVLDGQSRVENGATVKVSETTPP